MKRLRYWQSCEVLSWKLQVWTQFSCALDSTGRNDFSSWKHFMNIFSLKYGSGRLKERHLFVINKNRKICIFCTNSLSYISEETRPWRHRIRWWKKHPFLFQLDPNICTCNIFSYVGNYKIPILFSIFKEFKLTIIS